MNQIPHLPEIKNFALYAFAINFIKKFSSNGDSVVRSLYVLPHLNQMMRRQTQEHRNRFKPSALVLFDRGVVLDWSALGVFVVDRCSAYSALSVLGLFGSAVEDGR